MIGILKTINRKAKCFLNEKAQGIVEFALVCAFCAAIGLYAHDVGFSKGIKESFDQDCRRQWRLTKTQCFLCRKIP